MEKTFHMLLYRAFHAQRNYLRPYLGEIGLGPGQPKLLSLLSAHGRCRQRELADYFEIDPAAVCRMLDTLEKGGFVKRSMDETNRRADWIELTPKGQETCAAWQRHCRDMEQVMLRGFTEDEQAQFADYLARAYRNFSSPETIRKEEVL